MPQSIICLFSFVDSSDIAILLASYLWTIEVMDRQTSSVAM